MDPGHFVDLSICNFISSKKAITVSKGEIIEFELNL